MDYITTLSWPLYAFLLSPFLYSMYIQSLITECVGNNSLLSPDCICAKQRSWFFYRQRWRGVFPHIEQSFLYWSDLQGLCSLVLEGDLSVSLGSLQGNKNCHLSDLTPFNWLCQLTSEEWLLLLDLSQNQINDISNV